MLDTVRINEIVGEVATANLKHESVDRVVSEPATDSEGHEALRITIVLKPDVAAKLKGDAVLDTLVGVQQRLQKAGEERFPIVEYATEAEFEDVGDHQS